MITYSEGLAGISAADLRGGFFVGWPNPPTPEAHYRMLAGSAAIVLALSAEDGVVGYITAISDGISCAYIPHLEVLPAYQGRGIGSTLLIRMLAKLRTLYMVDLVCDPHLQAFYERHGMLARTGMALRHYDRQNWAPIE